MNTAKRAGQVHERRGPAESRGSVGSARWAPRSCSARPARARLSPRPPPPQLPPRVSALGSGTGRLYWGAR